MSYYVSLITFIDSETEHIEYEDNYTYNVYPMFRMAFGHNTGLYKLNGLIGEEAALELEQAINKMESSPKEYRQMNPANGWGNYEGAITFLENLKIACRLHPESTVYVVS